MNNRISLLVRMDLISDTITGSGYSIPGGEDIAICRDEEGHPFLKGSTFKGQLRESLENWLVWTNGSAEELNALLGESDRTATATARKLHLTELRLAEPPVDAGICYDVRTFTALENSVVKQGTLRTAACIRAGLSFCGEIECDENDAPLIESTLAGIKWIGTMRNRGFGRVRFTVEKQSIERQARPILAANCIRYQLLTKSPVLITDLSRSRGNGMESRTYIPGASIRGLVASTLAENDPDVFNSIRHALLGCGTRFLDAVPVQGALPPLPSPMGFYEDKAETVFQCILKDGSISPGLKRAELGSFCTLEGDTLRYWSANTGGTARISLSREKEARTELFQTRYLEAGQVLEGYILLDQPELAEQISKALCGTVWLGADRYGGFGKCEVMETDSLEQPEWINAYAYQTQAEIGTDLYLMALSPFTMLDEDGEPCGLDENELAEKLGVGSVSVKCCASSVVEFGGYNRVWKSRVPAVSMYERGSVFHLQCDKAPKLEKVRSLEHAGLGIRRGEGFGQILFLPPTLLEALRHKQAVETPAPEGAALIAEQRRNRLAWVMENAGTLNDFIISKSQLESLQSLAEKALRTGNDVAEIHVWLKKNLTERGVQHGNRFRRIADFVQKLLDPETELDALGRPSAKERLELLCLICNYSRKVREEGKAR